MPSSSLPAIPLPPGFTGDILAYAAQQIYLYREYILLVIGLVGLGIIIEVVIGHWRRPQ